MGSASYLVTFVFIFRNLLWGSVNNGQPLHGLHNTKRLRTTGLVHSILLNWVTPRAREQSAESLEINHKRGEFFTKHHFRSTHGCGPKPKSFRGRTIIPCENFHIPGLQCSKIMFDHTYLIFESFCNRTLIFSNTEASVECAVERIADETARNHDSQLHCSKNAGKRST